MDIRRLKCFFKWHRKRPRGKWVTKDFERLQIDGDVLTLPRQEVPEGETKKVTLMWVDLDGAPTPPSGEHLWTIKLARVNEGGSPFVGISSFNRLKQGEETTGIFYGGHLTTGGQVSIENWGPSLKSGSVLRMLVSFKEPLRLKLYFWLNGKPLGLAADLSVTSSFPGGFAPAIHWNEKGGTIFAPRKENLCKIPEIELCLDRIPCVGIEGRWKIRSESTQLSFENEGEGQDDGEEFLQNSDFFKEKLSGVSLEIVKQRGELYRVNLRVCNDLTFTIERVKGSWGSRSPGRTTLMYCGSSVMRLEELLREICQRPDRVDVGSENRQMRLIQGKSIVVFGRHVDDPTTSAVGEIPPEPLPGPESASEPEPEPEPEPESKPGQFDPDSVSVVAPESKLTAN